MRESSTPRLVYFPPIRNLHSRSSQSYNFNIPALKDTNNSEN